MAMEACPRCGHQNTASANFCSSCGADLGQTDHGTTRTVPVPIDQGADEVAVDLDDLPAGVGMLVVTRGPNSGSRFALDESASTSAAAATSFMVHP